MRALAWTRASENVSSLTVNHSRARISRQSSPPSTTVVEKAVMSGSGSSDPGRDYQKQSDRRTSAHGKSEDRMIGNEPGKWPSSGVGR